MKNILFVYYPAFVRFNHGSALLTAICKQAGIEADYCTCTELQDRMGSYDVIGFSFVTDEDYEQSLPYMQLAKDAGKKVIAGGGYARRGGKIEIADEICRGEAEDFIVTGDFRTGYIRPTIDNLPLPDLTHVTGYEFVRGLFFLKNVKIIPYQSSRGCYYGKCSFCEVQFQEKVVRIKHTIADDLKYLQRLYNPQLFYLMDTLVPAYLDEWREQWKDLYIPFQCYIRADIKPEYLEFLIKHGLKVTAFGIESGNEIYRNTELKKGLLDSQIMETIKILQKNDINYVPFFMTNTPNETLEDKKKTKTMISKVGGCPMVWDYQDLSKNIERRL